MASSPRKRGVFPHESVLFPQKVTLKHDALGGQMILRCSAVKTATAYESQLGTDPNNAATFKPLGQSSGSSYTASNVPQWFRGQAVGTGADNVSAWSDPAMGVAP